MSLNDNYTSTGAKFFAHQEVMTKLRGGQGQCITTHVMLTDICNHSCGFCSVQKRAGDSLLFKDVMNYLNILLNYGLKSVILSGGGNPILYKCKQSGKNFNDVVDAIHDRGLEIGLITNGMSLQPFGWEVGGKSGSFLPPIDSTRRSWKAVRPETLDKLTWIRISMSGLDHEEREVFVPDVDPSKTALGFSYVAHDLYKEPKDPYHGKVSRPLDLISGDKDREPDLYFEERADWLTEQFTKYVRDYKPRYLRLLPNCLEPDLIECRCKHLREIARSVNFTINREVVFVQNKPPAAPKACYLGYIHPVLNCDGFCYPCDSCVLNESAEHSFANPWRICHWKDIASIYEKPIESLIKDPAKTCPGCVFTKSNEILKDVVDGRISVTAPDMSPVHKNFV